MTAETACELCGQDGGEVIYSSAKLHVVLVDDDKYPGFCRVIWNAHVKEMTDLAIVDRSVMMSAVCRVESALREVMQPDKINLASLGNMTPHLHWHVIPRYVDDAHFPSPVWADSQRVPTSSDLSARRALLPSLRNAIVKHMECSA